MTTNISDTTTVYHASTWDQHGYGPAQAFTDLRDATDFIEDHLRGGWPEGGIDQGTLTRPNHWEYEVLAAARVTGVTVVFTWVEGVAA